MGLLKQASKHTSLKVIQLFASCCTPSYLQACDRAIAVLGPLRLRQATHSRLLLLLPPNAASVIALCLGGF